MIVITRCNDVREYEDALAALRRTVNRPTVGVRTQLKSLRRASSNKICEPGTLKGKNVLAFSGIGHPRSFERILTELTMKIKNHIKFPDHHWYTQENLELLRKEWAASKATAIITTEKDMVKLRQQFAVSFLDELPVYYAEIRQIVLADEKNLDNQLSKVLKSVP